MLDRQACERRVYRLAALLTGNPIAATGVISQVVDAQPDLSQLDSAHMDRLTVLRSREIRPARLVSDHLAAETTAALEGLLPQQREAWVFARIYRVPEREMARAMDCSVTATLRHLEQADVAMKSRLGTAVDSAVRELLAYSMSLDVPKFHRAAQLRRKHMRMAMMVILIAAAALAVAAVLTWWGRPLDGK